MYGFFNPQGSRLSEDEMRLFKAYYCRVCYCLRIAGGQTARFFTTYDMAMFSIVLNIYGKNTPPPHFRCEKFKKNAMRFFSDDGEGKRLAYTSVIVFGEKIRDDETDGNTLRAGFMNLIYRKIVKDARSKEPEIARCARNGADDIERLQNENAPLFTILLRYGKMISDMFSCVQELDERTDAALQSIAIWTFYMDMLYDYDGDFRSHSYNGFYREGFAHISDRFDSDYVYFLNVNRKISSMLRSSVDALKNPSPEWSVLNKITDAALSSAAAYAVMTKKERRRVRVEYIKRYLCRKKY